MLGEWKKLITLAVVVVSIILCKIHISDSQNPKIQVLSISQKESLACLAFVFTLRPTSSQMSTFNF